MFDVFYAGGPSKLSNEVKGRSRQLFYEYGTLLASVYFHEDEVSKSGKYGTYKIPPAED